MRKRGQQTTPALSDATHRFFQERGFVWLHAPIITTSDAEGAATDYLTAYDADAYADAGGDAAGE